MSSHYQNNVNQKQELHDKYNSMKLNNYGSNNYQAPYQQEKYNTIHHENNLNIGYNQNLNGFNSSDNKGRVYNVYGDGFGYNNNLSEERQQDGFQGNKVGKLDLQTVQPLINSDVGSLNNIYNQMQQSQNIKFNPIEAASNFHYPIQINEEKDLNPNTKKIEFQNNNYIQNQLKQSLKDMYVKDIYNNIKRRELEKQNKIKEEKEIIEKNNNLRKSEDMKNKYEQMLMKKMLFKDYITSNNLEQFYNKSKVDINENTNSYNNGKDERNSSPFNVNIQSQQNIEVDKLNTSVFNQSGFRFLQSIKPKRLNEKNLSNKIVRDYYKENSDLYSNSINFFNKDNKNDDLNFKKHGKKMNNFVDMSLYYNEPQYKQLAVREKEKEYLQTQGSQTELRAVNDYNKIQSNPHFLVNGSIRKNNKGIYTLPDIYLGESKLKQNPITNPVNYVDEERYKNYLNFLSK